MRYFFLIAIFVIFSQHTSAQKNVTITGKVTDENSLPLSGVSVHTRESQHATLTDGDGVFMLKMPEGIYRLVLSHVGYKPGEVVVSVSAISPVHTAVRLSPDASQMDEINISAVKMQTTTVTPSRVQVLDVPQAVSVVGQRLMRQQAVFDLTTLTRNIPGLTFTGSYSGAGSAQFFNARGFDLNETQNYRWNGMMVMNWGNQYADNIEQVEFLKGPASILIGDASPGGVMNFVTKKPLGDFSANINLKTGSWNLFRPSVDVTGPVLKDRSLRYRLNTSLEKKKSFRDHVGSTLLFAAPAITWDLSNKLSFNVEAAFHDSKATDDAGLVSPDGTAQGLKTLRPSLYLGESSREYLFNNESYFATLTYEPRPFWRIRAMAFRGITNNRPFGIWFDQPDTEGDFVRRSYGFYRRSINTNFSAEVSGIFFTGGIKHNVMAGVEYQTSRSRHTNGGELDSLDVDNLFSPRADRLRSPEPAESPLLPYRMIIERKAVQLHDHISFLKGRLFVYGGARLGTTSQGNEYLQKEAIGTTYEGQRDDVTEKLMFIPRFGLIFKPADNYSIYSSFSKGFEVNSPDIFAKNYLEYASPPATTSEQVEFGIKTSFLANRFGMTLAVFTINKEKPYGYVYVDRENPNFDEYNVYYQGHHRSQGIELEMDGRIFSFISVTGGAALTSTRVVYDPGYPTGNRLPNAPRFSFSYWINYEHPKFLRGFNASTGVFYQGNFYSGIDNNPNLFMQPACTWDAAIGYQNKRWGAQINVMNITNSISFLNPWQFNLFDVKPPRQITVTLNYKLGK
jgi:iron complex outermembrane receptor protein